MVIVELKPLFDRLNPYSRSAFENAAGLCVSRTHYEIAVEHLLVKLLDEPRSDIPLLLGASGIDTALFTRAVNRTLDDFRSGNAARPSFSPLLPELIQDAWLIASLTLFEKKVRSGALFLALLNRRSFFANGGWSDMLKVIHIDDLMEKFGNLTSGSLENTPGSRDDSVDTDQAINADNMIGHFCEDFTAKARDGKIDPVFGRDKEIRQMVDILSRRRKNNPICVGEPGVGKTAVVEGLALQIVEGDVPETIKDVTILGLDMALLQAGAGVKGEFERRLKGVIDEIKASPRPMILFIDEAHTLIGAGAQSGGSDAANLLKPALARGELRTIAATTWAEYKKYFERDAALARRFQPVKLDEPDADTAALILRGLKDRYEAVHKVMVRDDAIVACAELSDRYITGRQLPDKAVDLLDTACARVKISQSSKPDEIAFTEHQIAAHEREKQALLRDADDASLALDTERLEEIDQHLESLREQLRLVAERWQKEKDAAKAVGTAREFLAATAAGPDRDAARKAVIEAEASYRSVVGSPPMVFTEVEPDIVAKVVSDWTGIPLGKVLRDQAKAVLELQDNLSKRIRGQSEALSTICEVIKSSKSGLKDPAQPLGVFLLVGPSGVGKTETALSIADLMFGGEQAMVTINMSEFQEKHTVSRLVGSPPGYVGYGEGGVLTEAVRQRPYTVVLLDEVEKAHPDVLNLFYQVFDKGILSDGEGREIDFSNTVLFLTSNLATDVLTEMTQTDDRPPVDTVLAAIRPILSEHFKPALLARMTVVPYFTLDACALRDIVVLKLNRVVDRLMHNNHVAFEYDDSTVAAITQRCTEVETGARNIDFILRGSILPQLSQELLARMTTGDMPEHVRLTINDDGAFEINL